MQSKNCNHQTYRTESSVLQYTLPGVKRWGRKVNSISFKIKHTLFSSNKLDVWIKLINYKCQILCFRGVVQCLKLSPNLRKQTRQVEAAMFIKDSRKVFSLEQKILTNILEMTMKPEANSKTTGEEPQNTESA